MLLFRKTCPADLACLASRQLWLRHLCSAGLKSIALFCNYAIVQSSIIELNDPHCTTVLDRLLVVVAVFDDKGVAFLSELLGVF